MVCSACASHVHASGAERNHLIAPAVTLCQQLCGLMRPHYPHANGGEPARCCVVSAGEKKLAKLAAPDTWKAGSRNVAGGKDGGRLIGENKALTVSALPRNGWPEI